MFKKIWDFIKRQFRRFLDTPIASVDPIDTGSEIVPEPDDPGPPPEEERDPDDFEYGTG